jgi:hypothetical protein
MRRCTKAALSERGYIRPPAAAEAKTAPAYAALQQFCHEYFTMLAAPDTKT